MKYFLKENNSDGVDLVVPDTFNLLQNVNDLFLMAMGESGGHTYEERIWAGIILKVMHTIIHVDKDLRQEYFPVIQQQIFDQFYKFIERSSADDKLYILDQNREQFR